MKARHAAWVVAALLVGAATPALAQNVTVSCDFVEIGATNTGDAAVDKALPEKVQKRLKKKPFSVQWKVYKQLSSTTKVLAKKKTEKVSLSQGSASGTLVEVVDKSKTRLTLTMDDASGKQKVSQTSLIEGGDYTILVDATKDDGHLLAVTCK
jgi:hypothetical protein